MKSFPVIAALAVFAVLLPMHAQGQAVEAKIENVAVEVQKTPEFEVGNVKSKKVDKPRDWLEIEVEFQAASTDPQAVVVDQLLFKYYVAIKGPAGVTIFTGQTTHISIPVRTQTYSVAYLSPASLAQATGKYGTFTPSDVQAVAVEILYRGTVAGRDAIYSSLPTSSGRWWEASGSAQKVEGGVLSKTDTPFALLWTDRYADTAKEGQ